MTTYCVVFDIATNGYKYWGVIFRGSAMINTILISILLHHIFPTWKISSFRKKSLYLGLCFSIIWTVAVFASTYREHWHLKNILEQNKASVVQGAVRDFIPMPKSEHSVESFVVSGHKFQYSDYVMSPGFNNAASLGGPIRKGLYVRVTYWEKDIVRLEVATCGDPELTKGSMKEGTGG